MVTPVPSNTPRVPQSPGLSGSGPIQRPEKLPGINPATTPLPTTIGDEPAPTVAATGAGVNQVANFPEFELKNALPNGGFPSLASDNASVETTDIPKVDDLASLADDTDFSLPSFDELEGVNGVSETDLSDFDVLSLYDLEESVNWAQEGKSAYESSDFQTAAECFAEASYLDQDNPILLYNEGRSREKLGEVDLAQQLYQAALQLDPSLKSRFTPLA